LSVVLAFPSAFAPRRALVQAIRGAAGARLKIAFEDEFVVCETGDPVDLALKLESVFGIDRIAIAKRVRNKLEELSDAIGEIGSKTVLPGENFFVKVKADGKHDYAGRDVEFSSSSRLVAKLAEIGAHPAKSEQEANRVILAFAGRKFAYVCIKVSKGPGGLPYGSLGRALCSLHNPLSFLSCSMAVKAGFVPEVILLYSDEDELQANAKLAETLAKKIGNDNAIRIAPISIPRAKGKVAGLVKEAVAAEILIRQPNDRIVLPFTAAVHPLWFIEAIAGKAVAAGNTPYLPAMFADIPDAYAVQQDSTITKSEFQKYDSMIDAAARLSVKKMKKLKVGPNYLHDILDSV